MSDERATASIDSEKAHMYEEITKDENSIFKSNSKTVVYVMSAALGYFFKEFKEIPSKNRQDLFVSTTLGSDSDEKLWIMKSIAISNEGIEVLDSMKKVIKICDAYANAGIERLYELHKTSYDETSDLAMLMKDALDSAI